MKEVLLRDYSRFQLVVLNLAWLKSDDSYEDLVLDQMREQLPRKAVTYLRTFISVSIKIHKFRSNRSLIITVKCFLLTN